MSIRRGPLLLMRAGGALVAVGIACAYLIWALSYSRVNLASIAIPVGLVLIVGTALFIAGAFAASGKR